MKILGIVLLGLSAALLLKGAGKPEMVLLTEVLCGLLLLVMGLSALKPVLEAVQEYLPENDSFPLALRLTGITLLMEFAVQLCRDAGMNSLAQNAELCGKALLLSFSLPVLRQLSEGLLALLS